MKLFQVQIFSTASDGHAQAVFDEVEYNALSFEHDCFKVIYDNATYYFPLSNTIEIRVIPDDEML